MEYILLPTKLHLFIHTNPSIHSHIHIHTSLHAYKHHWPPPTKNRHKIQPHHHLVPLLAADVPDDAPLMPAALDSSLFITWSPIKDTCKPWFSTPTSSHQPASRLPQQQLHNLKTSSFNHYTITTTTTTTICLHITILPPSLSSLPPLHHLLITTLCQGSCLVSCSVVMHASSSLNTVMYSARSIPPRRLHWTLKSFPRRNNRLLTLPLQH